VFTGIVRHVGLVRDVRRTSAARRVTIDLGPLAEGLCPGDSVAVCGTCLTAGRLDAAAAQFDVVGETLSRTTLGQLRPGCRVNLERSLRLGDALDGHLVQGHVDGTAQVRSIRRGDQHVVVFKAGAELTEEMVPKGSVAIDGVSLTLVEVGGEFFSVALIPITLGQTTLGALAVGDKVNVETDILGKYVRRYLSGAKGSSSGGLTLEKLRSAGFAQ